MEYNILSLKKYKINYPEINFDKALLILKLANQNQSA